MRFRPAILLAINVFLSTISLGDELAWKAGVATVAVTPNQPMWMAGYASRTKPSEGVLSELHAKALAIEDSAGARVVIVTTDLISIPRELRLQVAKGLDARQKLSATGIVLNCSHTHCSPVVRDDLEMSVMYPLEPEQRRRVEAYFVELRDKMIGVIGAALDDLQPAKLSYSHARCGFAMNRRLPTPEDSKTAHIPTVRWIKKSPYCESSRQTASSGRSCSDTLVTTPRPG